MEARIARRPLVTLEEGRNIAVKLARAVAALHRSDLIHRDIKPDNVILERDVRSSSSISALCACPDWKMRRRGEHPRHRRLYGAGNV